MSQPEFMNLLLVEPSLNEKVYKAHEKEIKNLILTEHDKVKVLNTKYITSVDGYEYFIATPLTFAINSEMSTDFLEFLIKQGADVNENYPDDEVQEEENEEENENEEEVKDEYEENEEEEEDEYEYKSPSFGGYKSPSLEDARFYYGGAKTPLAYLLQAESMTLDRVKMFVENGACITLNVLDMASRYNPEFLPYLKEELGRQQHEFFSSWMKMNLNAKNRKDAFAENVNGDTLLILAAYNGNLEEVKNLLDIGSKINHKNKKGQTALHNAAYNKQSKVIKFLLSRGANPNIRDDNGNIYLQVIAFSKLNK